MDASGKREGSYRTITQAVKAAQQGEKIVVLNGFYNEQVHINKPIDLVALKAGDVSVVSAEGDVITFDAPAGRIYGLIVHQNGGAGNDHVALRAQTGRLDVEECDMCSLGGACVSIEAGADPTLRRNRIHGGKREGVVVHGEGHIEDNRVYLNFLSGIHITAGGNPTVRKNDVYENKAFGIEVSEGGVGVVRDNLVRENATAGLCVSSGANPTITNNDLVDGHGVGVQVRDGGLGKYSAL